ncbi:MAG: polysaccharide biosynthesis/export family protein [Ferruginibacter sp.]
MKKPGFFIVFSVSVILFFNACTHTKDIYLFNNQKPEVQSLDSVASFAVHTIHPNDRLNIIVSSTDPALTAFLNPFNMSMNQNNANNPQSGYLVDPTGSIEFPLIGKVDVNGKTSVQVADIIKQKLTYYYKDLFVNVNINGRIYFLVGNRGSSIPLINERMTILEALSQSGIQDPFDLKKQVWIIREDSGKRVFTQINLNSNRFFQSQYYHLQNNDLIYIKPGKVATWLGQASPVRGAFTILGSIAAIILAIKRI